MEFRTPRAGARVAAGPVTFVPGLGAQRPYLASFSAGHAGAVRGGARGEKARLIPDGEQTRTVPPGPPAPALVIGEEGFSMYKDIAYGAVAVAAALALSGLGAGTGALATAGRAGHPAGHAAASGTAGTVPGAQLWVQRYNGPANGDDRATAVAV